MKFVGTIFVVSLFVSVGFAGHQRHRQLDYIEAPAPGYYQWRAESIARHSSFDRLQTDPEILNF